MKKIYSFVLMAVALLIGTNVSAKTWQVGTIAKLEEAWQSADSADVIRLTSSMQATKTFWLGTTNKTNAPKSITLDLNGYTLEGIGIGNANTANGMRSMFVVSHGELNVISSIPGGRIESNQWINGGGNIDQELFRVSGTDDENQDPKMTPDSLGKYHGYYSHLTIGENVLVHAKHMNAIVVDAPNASWPTLKSTNAVAQKGVTLSTTAVSVPNTCANRSNGVRIDISGTVKGTRYALKVNGNVGKPDNTDYSTFCHVHPTGYMWVPDTTSNKSKKPAAVYCSGYSRWLVEGTCIGATGLFAKSGEIDIVDATIESNYTDTYLAPKEKDGISGVSASGSALVIQSTSGYPGDIEVTISGDSKLSATNGYAIEEVVTAKDSTTDVQKITIESGTFDGGKIPADPADPEGAQKDATMIISTVTATASQQKDTAIITINGFAVTSSTGSASTDVSSTFIGEQNLVEFMNSQSGETHVTFIEQEDGRKTMVISDGPAPDEPAPGEPGNSVEAASDSTRIKWVNTEDKNDTITADKNLKELEINEDYVQTLVVAENVTFTVERVVLGKNARIIVKAGGKFIVTGAQGIIAPVVDNILVEASETKQGMFFFNPAVSSNRHPNATVQLYTYSKQLSSSPWTYTYQRFSIPMKKGIVPPTNDFSGDLFPGNASFKTYAWQWNGTSWENLSSWATVEPFKGYQLANNSNDGGVTYTFTGRLVGNHDAEYDFPTGGYDFFGSSHIAPIYIDSLLKPYLNTNMEATVWVYDYEHHNFATVTLDDLKENMASHEIKPMDGFVLRIRNVASGKAGMSYASAIWGNPNLDVFLGRDPQTPTYAPARNRANEVANRVIINVTAENGYGDMVKLIENEQFSAEFDNGADASKYMFAEGINLYATTEAGELSRVATDDLKGTLLSFRSGNGTQYTINMSNVLGEDYALRDNVTGQVITLAEGATYTFMQEANTTVPARFEVIGVAEIPTAIENVEETAKVNGIYTMTGQYVGRDFTKLPAGVYVVNGVKIVK